MREATQDWNVVLMPKSMIFAMLLYEEFVRKYLVLSHKLLNLENYSGII